MREEGIEKNARLLDVFNKPLQVYLEDLKREMKEQFGVTLTDLAWNASDNLIEQEIKHLEEGKRSVFPREMTELLRQMRQKRAAILSDIMQTAEGNLVTSRIYPERVFSTLSSGEKRRTMCLLAYEMAKTHSSIRLVILDEPLTHLDTENMDFQIKTIQRIQSLPNPPALLIISHHFITTLKEHLKHVQLVQFMKEMS